MSTVALTTPPMTTVASGRWTSEPGAVDRAMGMKPSTSVSAWILVVWPPAGA